jgi:hypothetical protein
MVTKWSESGGMNLLFPKDQLRSLLANGRNSATELVLEEHISDPKVPDWTHSFFFYRKMIAASNC